MTKATKRTIGVICLLWLGTLLLLFANYKTKVYLEQLRSQVDAVTQQEQANATAVKRQPSRTMEDVLVRTDAQLVTTSFSNENYAAKAMEKAQADSGACSRWNGQECSGCCSSSV